MEMMMQPRGRHYECRTRQEQRNLAKRQREQELISMSLKEAKRINNQKEQKKIQQQAFQIQEEMEVLQKQKKLQTIQALKDLEITQKEIDDVITQKREELEDIEGGIREMALENIQKQTELEFFLKKQKNPTIPKREKFKAGNGVATKLDTVQKQKYLGKKPQGSKLSKTKTRDEIDIIQAKIYQMELIKIQKIEEMNTIKVEMEEVLIERQRLLDTMVNNFEIYIFKKREELDEILNREKELKEIISQETQDTLQKIFGFGQAMPGYMDLDNTNNMNDARDHSWSNAPRNNLMSLKIGDKTVAVGFEGAPPLCAQNEPPSSHLKDLENDGLSTHNLSSTSLDKQSGVDSQRCCCFCAIL